MGFRGLGIFLLNMAEEFVFGLHSLENTWIRRVWLMEEPKDTSSKSLCGGNPLQNPRVSKVLFKWNGIGLQIRSVYQRIFSPRHCNSLSLKWSLYVWNILDTVLTPQIQSSGDKRKMFRLQRGTCSALKNTCGFRQKVSYLLSE